MKNYTAKEVAAGLSVSVATLHYYEKAGLLPQIYRDQNNTRRYTDDNVQWLEMIVMMREVGVPIAEIRTYCQLLMAGPETIQQRLAVVQEYHKKLAQQREQIENCLSWLTRKEAFYQKMIQQGISPDSFGEEADLFRSEF